MATQCHSRFGFRFQRKLTVDFNGSEITGDAGLLLLREFDERLGLTAGLQKSVIDDRDKRYVRHAALDLLRQRIYQIAAGWQQLRQWLVELQSATAANPAMCRQRRGHARCALDPVVPQPASSAPRIVCLADHRRCGP